jgi:formylglycine-generating enzyme required for sulfatase activity
MKNLIRAVAGMLALTVAMEAGAQGCVGDLTGNGNVDGADLSSVLAYWGPRTQDPSSVAADVDGSGLIDGADLSILLAAWGPCRSTVTGISPNQGCVLGGTQITISGTYLGSASAVSFGGAPAASFTVVNGTTLRAVTPAGTLGSVDIRVTTASGMTTAPQQFTYMPPSVSSIVPNVGVFSGGTRLTISGAYLGSTTAVTIGGAPATGVQVIDANTVTVVTPPGILGPADVTVIGGKGVVNMPSAFSYVAVFVPSWATLIEATPDPSVVASAALRQGIVDTGLAWRIRDTGTGIEMVLVPPSTFLMGSPDAWASPVHQVTLTRAYYMARFEVTQGQWTAVMHSNPSAYQWSSDRPVEQIGWDSIQPFLSATGLRLPTEAEWECAYRAGTTTSFHSMPGFPNGTDDASSLSQIAWFGGSGWTRPVGMKQPNGLGIYDMSGNVVEVVNDWFSGLPATPQTDPVGPASGPFRVMRGGSWLDGSGFCTAWARYYVSAGPGAGVVGFPVARDP